MRTLSEWYSPRYLILPGIYVVVVALTAALSPGTPGGAYYRIIGLCPPAMGVGMVSDNAAVVVGAFLLFGTPWWYMVGRIGWDTHERRRRFLTSLRGAAIALFTCLVSSGMTRDVFKSDGPFTNATRVQYWLAAILCLGSLFSMLTALRAAFNVTQES